MSGEFHTNEVKFPAAIVATSPLSVTKSGATYTFSINLSGFITAEGTAWVGQVHKALETLGHYDTINEAIPSTPSNALRLSWLYGWRTGVGDTLYTFIESKIGTSNANAVYTLAPSMII